MNSQPLKVLFYSTAFDPMIGGLENVVENVATQLHQLGCEVTVACLAEGPGRKTFEFPIVRRPDSKKLSALVTAADVVLYANQTMKAIHPALLRRKPIVVTHQGCYSDPSLPPTLAARVKRIVSRWTTNITCSRAVADYLGAPATVIPNPYDNTTFKLMPEVPRTKPLLFVGRLVSVKGIDLIVRALAILKQRGKTPPLTIAGRGPEEEIIKKLAAELGVADQITFLGPVTGEPLARLMNEHRIMLVPSRWEPFGIVALEGIACGCWVIGADDGGLRDAIGPCGEIFATESHEALANSMERALDRPEHESPIDDATRSQHLSEHTARAVALRYLAVLEKAAGRKAR